MISDQEIVANAILEGDRILLELALASLVPVG